MNRVIAFTIAIASFIGLPGIASAADSDTLISLQRIDERGVSVELPTVRRADGSTCVGYIASSRYDKESEQMDIRISRICGQPRPGESTPAQLISMGQFTTAGLTVQTPTISVKD